MPKEVDDFFKEKLWPLLKKGKDKPIESALYTLYGGLILGFIIIYGYLVTIAIQLSKAREYGRRLQEECGNVYMEAETARNQIYNSYAGDGGNIANRLNGIKNGIFAISIIIVTIVYFIMAISSVLDKQLLDKWFNPFIGIIVFFFYGIVFSMIGTYKTYNADKDYRDLDSKTSIGNKEEQAGQAKTSIDATFSSAIASMIGIFIVYFSIIKYKNIDGSKFMELKNHIFTLIIIVIILYIILRLYSSIVNNMNNYIISRYNNEILSIKNSVVKPIMGETSAVNYLQNNLRRLEPNSKEIITTNSSYNATDPKNYYRLLEHSLGRESFYYADATVPAKIKAADMQGLAQKFNNTALIKCIKSRTLQDNVAHIINSNTLPIAEDNGRYKFNITDTGCTANTTVSAAIGSEIMDILYSGYSVIQPYTPGQNILALFSESNIKDALSKVQLNSVTKTELFTRSNGNYSINLDRTEIKNVFTASLDTDSTGNLLGPSIGINIGNNPSETANVTLKNVYLVFNRLKNNDNYKNEAGEIIKQMKMNLLYTMLNRPIQTNNTRNTLQTKMAELRSIDYVETVTDDFTRLIAIGFIIPVLIVFGIIYNKIYNANPGFTTMAIVIFIFAAVFAITWYAWFAGNILL